MPSDERRDFTVVVRVVYPMAVSEDDLDQHYEGSTLAAAHSLIGTERRLPKNYTVIQCGFTTERGEKWLANT